MPIATIMLFQVAALAVRSFVQSGLIDGGYDGLAAKRAGAIAGFAVLAMLLLPFATTLRTVIGTHFRSPASWTRLIFASCALGGVLWLGQMLALLAITPMSWVDPEPFEKNSAPTYIIACENPALLLVAIPLMVAITPLFEEVINRGILLNALLHHGRTLAILASAVLFAILHPLATIPFAFLFGIAAAIQMLHFRTLWAPVITHATVNLLVEISRTCIRGTWHPGLSGWIGPGRSLLIVLSLTACGVLGWWLAARTNAGAEPIADRPGAD